MSVKQIAIFVENRKGAITEITDIMAENQIDIRALSISEAPDFGILRMIVNNTEKACNALSEKQFVCSLNDVVGVEIPDKPGSIAKVIKLLSDNDVNIEYLYAFVGDSGKNAWVVFRVENNEKAEKVLSLNEVRVFSDRDIGEI